MSSSLHGLKISHQNSAKTFSILNAKVRYEIWTINLIVHIDVCFWGISIKRMSSPPHTPTNQSAGPWGEPLTPERIETRPARLAPIDLFVNEELNCLNGHGHSLGPSALQFFLEL